MDRRQIIRTGLGLSAAALAAGCTTTQQLGLFDAAVPDHGGARMVASGQAYGPHPRQTLDVWIPSGSAPGPWPLVVYFHGGSWNSGSRTVHHFVGAALASLGMVAVLANYRLVPEVRFPLFLDDCAAAVAWARAQAGAYGAMPDAIVLAGHSAGAYNAAMLALQPSRLDAAGVPAAAVKGLVGLSGPYDFLPFDSPETQAAFGGWPVPAETQPISSTSAAAPPALLATGDADTVVLPRNSEALAARLSALGVPVTLRLYPGASHADVLTGLSRPLAARTPVRRDIRAFLAGLGLARG